MLSQLQAQIPDPLREDLPELLPEGAYEKPSGLGLALDLHLPARSQRTLDGKREIKNIGGSEGVWRDGGEELLIDRPVASRTDAR